MQPYRAPTPGTRVAVWMFPALTLWLGLGYLFGGPQRFQSGAFEAAKQIGPMHVWGLVFVAVAAIKVVCLLRDRPRGYVAAMCLGMGLYAWWAVLFAASVVADDRTSPGAPAWPLFVVGMHDALLTTITGKSAIVSMARMVTRPFRRG